MPQDVQFGTVQYFNPQKRYGFIQSDSGEKVFFHVNGRGGPEVIESTFPRLHWRVTLALVAATSQEVRPKDRLCYRQTPDTRGPRATVWTFEDIWLRVVDEVRHTRFRVIRNRTILCKNKLVVHEPEVIFEGTADQLDEAYPQSLSDVLASSDTPIVKSSCSYSYLRDGAWVDCKDPRTPSPRG